MLVLQSIAADENFVECKICSTNDWSGEVCKWRHIIPKCEAVILHRLTGSQNDEWLRSCVFCSISLIFFVGVYAGYLLAIELGDRAFVTQSAVVDQHLQLCQTTVTHQVFTSCYLYRYTIQMGAWNGLHRTESKRVN